MSSWNRHTTTWSCNFDDSTQGYYFTVGAPSIEAQSPLGSGHVGKLALFIEEAGLEPTCYSAEGMGYLYVPCWDDELREQISEYALSIGFKKGDVEIKGDECLCKTL